MRRIWSAISHLPALLWFLLVFVYELALASAAVSWDVVRPGTRLEPGIVRVPTSCTTDVQMTLLANTLTMTPGTLSLEVDTTTRELYVHGLYAADRERFIADVHAIERVLLRAIS